MTDSSGTKFIAKAEGQAEIDEYIFYIGEYMDGNKMAFIVSFAQHIHRKSS